MEFFINVAAVVVLILGAIHLLQVIVGKWDTPSMGRTVYGVVSVLFGIAILAQVGLQGGIFFLCAGVGVLQHLSAMFVHIAFCVKRRKRVNA